MPMQPRPRAETSRLLFPNLRFCIVVLVLLTICPPYLSLGLDPAWFSLQDANDDSCIGLTGVIFARRDFDCGGTSACGDHRAQVRAAMILRPVGVIDLFVDGSVHRLEGDLLRHAGRDD